MYAYLIEYNHALEMLVQNFNSKSPNCQYVIIAKCAVYTVVIILTCENNKCDTL